MMEQVFDLNLKNSRIKLKGRQTWDGGTDEFAALENFVSGMAKFSGMDADKFCQIGLFMGAETIVPLLASKGDQKDAFPIMVTYFLLTRQIPDRAPLRYCDLIDDHSFQFKVRVRGDRLDMTAICTKNSVLLH
jgi:hypothetical protein